MICHFLAERGFYDRQRISGISGKDNQQRFNANRAEESCSLRTCGRSRRNLIALPKRVTRSRYAEHLIKEIGDAEWMLAELMTSQGISFDEVLETNIEKLKKRYPDGFAVERSLHRETGDI